MLRPPRRALLAGGAVALHWLASPCPSCSAQASPSRIYGCAMPEPEARRLFGSSSETRRFSTGEEPMIRQSGDRDFDRALAHTLARIGELFRVWPGFAYFQEPAGQNAYATKTARLNGADGTVLFGRNLLAELLRQAESPEIAVAAVCAHEFGHILQFSRNLDQHLRVGQRTVKRVELQADYFSGYFAGIRKRERPGFPAAIFAVTHYSLGDDRIDQEQHHGTPDERAAAIGQGFEAGFRQRLGLDDAVAASTSYAAGL